MQQKSRGMWLEHASTVIRRKRNHIWVIKDDEGYWLNSRKRIGDHFVDKFCELFTTENPTFPVGLEGLFDKVISPEENCELMATPTREEVWKTIKSMVHLKVLGLEDFSRGVLSPLLGYCWGSSFRVCSRCVPREMHSKKHQ